MTSRLKWLGHSVVPVVVEDKVGNLDVDHIFKALNQDEEFLLLIVIS